MINKTHLHLFIPLLLQNESFVKAQIQCNPDAGESWGLALLKALGETVVTESYSNAFNARIRQKGKYEFEGKFCSESNMLSGGHLTRTNAKKFLPDAFDKTNNEPPLKVEDAPDADSPRDEKDHPKDNNNYNSSTRPSSHNSNKKIRKPTPPCKIDDVKQAGSSEIFTLSFGIFAFCILCAL